MQFSDSVLLVKKKKKKKQQFCQCACVVFFLILKVCAFCNWVSAAAKSENKMSVNLRTVYAFAREMYPKNVKENIQYGTAGFRTR